MRTLATRLKKLENVIKVNDFIVYEIFEGDNPAEKKQAAWQEYIEKGGRGAYDKVKFVQVNIL